MALDAATQVLTFIAVLLLVGIIISWFSKKIKLSNVLLLIIAGVLLGKLSYGGEPIIVFEGTFLVAIAVLTLVMVVFDGASRFEIKNVDKFSVAALRTSVVFVLLNTVLMTLFTLFLFFSDFSFETVLFAMLFSIVMSGTDPASVFIMLKSKTNRVIDFLELEAIINTPIIVIFPFLILDIINNLGSVNVADAVVSQIAPFLQQIIVGVGTGVLMGLIVFRIMKKFYSQAISPVALITAALLSYIIAENLAGNGVLAVATLGLFFGNSYVRGRSTLQEFNSMLNSSLIILVFLLIGFIVPLNFSFWFLLKALGLFFVLVLVRLTAISYSLKGSVFNSKEKIFMALSMPKGIAVAVVAFSLSVFPISAFQAPLINTVLQLMVVSMVYSLVLSSIIDKFSYSFIRLKLEDDK